MIPREVTSKQESNNDGEVSMPSSSSTTSWSKSKDPRIVRVSRAFGGKDRHSKVCTVKGLRDRRVRLSVPTAIQLYDLQERLGLNQPSKVVDWLLTAAKNEIDELPPLQIPQGSFMMMQSLHQSHDDHNQFLAASQSAKQGLKISDQSGKFKDASRENITSDRNHEAWERQFNHDQNYFLSSSRQHINNPSNSLLSLLNNNNSSPFLRWDSSNLTLSHPPISLGLADHHNHDHQHDDQDLQNFSLLQFPSSLSTATPSGSHHQVLVYQPGITTQPYFPSQIEEFDSKQSNFQSSELSNSSQTHVRPLHFSMTANLFPSQNNAVNEENRHNELHRS